MKNLIGGLFKTQENANQAYEALQRSGFAGEEVNLFVHKPHIKTARATNVKVQQIGRDAFWGGLIGGVIGAFLGFLVGSRAIPFPGLAPAPIAPVTFLLAALGSGLVLGGLTGVILGAVSKLLLSREKAEVMTDQIEKRGVLVTVGIHDPQNEKRARRILQENGAEEVGNPAEKWDVEAWFNPNEADPSLKNIVNAR